ncbi:uncharacterized protein TM35_000113510 [Trypanosoma theileri]|uniref:Membrane protein n=1 Tax=Trypanosoma theileri TaxID=67003 RepID=A0A1X0NYR3_9TRYP|nr:uncharacterized protein TM35_000113510 [Trypanosoma theileri]ORC89817.1 membrane protein [Trypanosoma theileri]
MPTEKNPLLTAAASSGLIGVVAGAFGVHYLRDRLTAAKLSSWTSAVQFNLIHSAAQLAVIALLNREDPQTPAAKHLNRASQLMLTGTVLFSGSIYALCLGVLPKVMGPLTPIGGISLMLGWISAALAGL